MKKLVVLAVALLAVLGLITYQAHAETNISELYDRQEKAHQCAEMMREMGYESGSWLQQLALKQMGIEWHECQDKIDAELAEQAEEAAAETAEAEAEAEVDAESALIEEEVQEEEQQLTSLGVYWLTAYTWTGNTMANGQYPYVGAVACNSIPLGTRIYIDGMGEYVVCDRVGNSGRIVDIYMDTYDECVQFGSKKAEVFRVD